MSETKKRISIVEEPGCKGEESFRNIERKAMAELAKPDVEAVIGILRCNLGCKDKKDDDTSTTDGRGPAKVNSQLFKDGWERIFGEGKINKEDLN